MLNAHLALFNKSHLFPQFNKQMQMACRPLAHTYPLERTALKGQSMQILLFFWEMLQSSSCVSRTQVARFLARVLA